MRKLYVLRFALSCAGNAQPHVATSSRGNPSTLEALTLGYPASRLQETLSHPLLTSGLRMPGGSAIDAAFSDAAIAAAYNRTAPSDVLPVRGLLLQAHRPRTSRPPASRHPVLSVHDVPYESASG
jgi:hypothetical protein